jgi:hypothetical protein
MAADPALTLAEQAIDLVYHLEAAPEASALVQLITPDEHNVKGSP